MEQLLEGLSHSIGKTSFMVFIMVFLGGVVTSLSPCILAMLPVMVGYIGGYGQQSRMRSFVLALLMVLGLSTTFTILGISASLLGKVFGNLGRGWYLFLGILAVVMGLNLMEVLHFSLPGLKSVPLKLKGGLGAYLAGLFFGLAASPCTTPVLAVILAYIATQGNVLYGASLLFVYGLGHGLILMLVGGFTGVVKKLSPAQKYTRYFPKVSGALLLGFGVYVILKFFE